MASILVPSSWLGHCLLYFGERNVRNLRVRYRIFLSTAYSYVSLFFSQRSSSGKVAYFTALFPYVVLVTLLIRGATLPGAGDGMLFFITPVWETILTPEVMFEWLCVVLFIVFILYIFNQKRCGMLQWLNVSSRYLLDSDRSSSFLVSILSVIQFTGAFNDNFNYNIWTNLTLFKWRDSTIISFADTGTSILAGITIFAILGNLSHESGKPIQEVVKSGTGLAFVSYPEAISKFNSVPQVFTKWFTCLRSDFGYGISNDTIHSSHFSCSPYSSS